MATAAGTSRPSEGDQATLIMWRRFIDMPVWLSPLGILLCCASAPFFFPLIPRYGERLADVRTFAPTLAGGLSYAAVVTLSFFLCWLSSAQARAGAFSPRLSTLAMVGALFGLPLLFVYPINAADVFLYFMYGRVTAVYGDSPFVSSPGQFQGDPFLRFGGEWASGTSPYGPLWEALGGGIVHLADGELLPSLLLFKCVGLACHLAIGGLLYFLLEGGSPAQRASRCILWFWNPALLLMFVVDAHNDAVMLLWLFLGFYLVRRDKALAGLSVMMLAPLTKVIGVLALPFFLIAHLRGRADARQRLRFVVLLSSIGVALFVLSFLPFGGVRESAQRIWEESRAGASFSFLAAVRYLGEVVDGFDPRLKRWQIGATTIFVATFLLLLSRTARGRRSEAGVADTFFLYVLTAARFRIWYPVWILPWILVDQGGSPRAGEARLRVAYLFLWTSQISVVLYGHLYVEWLNRSRAAAHLIGVPFVFLVPLLVGLLFLSRNVGASRSAAR